MIINILYLNSIYPNNLLIFLGYLICMLHCTMVILVLLNFLYLFMHEERRSQMHGFNKTITKKYYHDAPT